LLDRSSSKDSQERYTVAIVDNCRECNINVNDKIVLSPFERIIGLKLNGNKRAQSTIQVGERNEVNPWVERTQWLPYLVGMEPAIWEAMDKLTRFSQASVIERVGVFVRLEASRTVKHQTRFQPQQPYMDKEAIVKHTRPW
jgi:hypothetical protein